MPPPPMPHLCLTNSGLPLHLKVTDFPSGISSSLISIFAKARTSALADMDETNCVTMVLAEYMPVTVPPKDGTTILVSAITEQPVTHVHVHSCTTLGTREDINTTNSRPIYCPPPDMSPLFSAPIQAQVSPTSSQVLSWPLRGSGSLGSQSVMLGINPVLIIGTGETYCTV